MDQAKTKIGIYGSALLMMGVIGVAGALATIGANFPDASPVMIQSIISIPCLVIIPVTLIVGKLMQYISKKNLIVVGVILFLIGGIVPAFMSSLTAILVMRALLGIGVGLVQPTVSAVIAEEFEGPERDKVQGNMTAFQMVGCGVMVFAGGYLGNISWDKAFYVHLVGIIALACALVFLPNKRPAKASSVNMPKEKLNSGVWVWAAIMFIFFIAGQIYSVFLSYLLAENSIPAFAAVSGLSLAFFCLGGIISGVIFGKIMGFAKNTTLAIGFILLGASYLVIAYASAPVMVHLGSFICGLAFSIVMPCVIISGVTSATPATAGIAISIIMCSQNFSQFLAPYIVNPIGLAMSADKPNQAAFIFGAALIIVMGVGALIWGVSKNKKVVAVI